ncbi:MAG: LysR family transcriptional regulator [Candidatus Sericytochromatia bacterium]|nr:LysR family transcriptional regulator [Candidatus Sericytochromatia bacterium]
MKNLSLHWLQQFQQLIEIGNYTETARKLKISQQALSKNILALESWAGHALLIRQGGKHELTWAGELLKDQIPGLLQNLRELEKEFQTHPSQIHLGIDPLFGHLFLEDILPTLLQRWPDVDLRVLPMRPPDLQRLLLTGYLDAALITGPSPAQFEKADLPALRWTVISTPELYQKGPPCDFIHYSTPLITEVFQDSSLLKQPIQYKAQTNHWRMMKTLVLAGIGIGFILEACVKSELAKGDLIALPLPENIPRLETAAIWIKGNALPPFFLNY